MSLTNFRPKHRCIQSITSLLPHIKEIKTNLTHHAHTGSARVQLNQNIQFNVGHIDAGDKNYRNKSCKVHKGHKGPLNLNI